MPVEVKRSNRGRRRARWPYMPHCKGSSCKERSHLYPLGHKMRMQELAVELLRGWRVGMPFGKRCRSILGAPTKPPPKCPSCATNTCITIFEFHCAQDDLDLIQSRLIGGAFVPSLPCNRCGFSSRFESRRLHQPCCRGMYLFVP